MKMNFTLPMLTTCKSYLSFIKSKSRIKKSQNKELTSEDNNGTNKMDRDEPRLECLSFSESDQNREKDLNWCRQQLAKGRKIIFVLYANDCENGLEQLTSGAVRQPNGVHQSWDAIFELKLINVQDEEQLSVVSRVQRQLTCQLSTLVCILISGVMSNLINCDTSPVRHCLAPYCSLTDSHDYDRMPVLFALYDELNEINMFRMKYKLGKCTYISSDTNHLRRNILCSAIAFCNETLFHRHTKNQHPTDNHYRKPSFKVFPKSIDEANAKVLLWLDETVLGDQLVDVLLNGQSTFGWLQVKWRKPSTLSFTVPADRLQSSTLNISVAINCTTWIGTRQIKCEKKEIELGNMIPSVNSAHYLCESLGAQSMQQLDQKLAQVFNESLSDFGIFSHVTSRVDKINLWLPTWLHFVSAYGLKECALNLLKLPASMMAYSVRNSDDLKPIDLAIKNGHWELVHILEDYAKQSERVQQDLENLVIGEVSGNNLFTGYLCSTSRHACSAPNDRDQQLLESTEKSGSTKSEKSEMTETESSEASSDHPTCSCSTFQCNHRILQAKNELLLLIEKFKCGISIECFEQMFSNWEATYKDVLEGQMSHELQYSLNQIKKLCSFNDHEEDYEESEHELENVSHGYPRSEPDQDGDDRAKQQHRKEANRFGGHNEADRNEPNAEWANIIRTHAHADDRLADQLNHRPQWNTSNQIALHHKSTNWTTTATTDAPSDRMTGRWNSLSRGLSGHLNLFAIDSNRQFSRRDLNSINMPDNEVRRKERTNWLCPLPTVSNCQTELHQFGPLVHSAKPTYMPSRALWGQLARNTMESISPPESESNTNAVAPTHSPSDDNNGNTCRLARTRAAHRQRGQSTESSEWLVRHSKHLACSSTHQLTNSSEGLCLADKSNQVPCPIDDRPDCSAKRVNSHDNHDLFKAAQSNQFDLHALTKDCSLTIEDTQRKPNGATSEPSSDRDSSNRLVGAFSQHYYLIPSSIPVPVSICESTTLSNKQ